MTSFHGSQMRAIWRPLAVVMLLACAGVSDAQTAGGALVGVVVDEQNRSVPGVVVSVRGSDVSQTFTTDADGRYRFLDLAPGRYELSASSAGFSTVVRDGLIVDVGRTADVLLALKVSAVAETVNVVAPSPVVDRQQTGIATHI